ncbi:MAG: hypothetical protein K8S18_08030 [Desulfobacula sp.]|nr:hypothetical protein [Desulfobacula sp.]
MNNNLLESNLLFVRPDLFSVLSAWKTSGLVIAINTDENAAIMSDCDYYVLEWQGKKYPKPMFFFYEIVSPMDEY